MTLKQQIREYVDDHYEHFGFYPYDVEVDGQIYSYGGYWAILEDGRFDQWHIVTYAETLTTHMRGTPAPLTFNPTSITTGTHPQKRFTIGGTLSLKWIVCAKYVSTLPTKRKN